MTQGGNMNNLEKLIKKLESRAIVAYDLVNQVVSSHESMMKFDFTEEYENRLCKVGVIIEEIKHLLK